MTVPVVLTVPVNITVPVDIPLDQTELHQPFSRLESTVGPYNELIAGVPTTWDEALCKYLKICWFTRRSSS